MSCQPQVLEQNLVDGKTKNYKNVIAVNVNMDDIVLFHESKEYLKNCLVEIEKIIIKYKLKLNEKTKIYSSREEVEFLGFRFINKNKIIMKVSNKTKKRFIKKMKKIHNNSDNYNEIISSYLRHLHMGDSCGLIYKYIDNYKC